MCERFLSWPAPEHHSWRLLIGYCAVHEKDLSGSWAAPGRLHCLRLCQLTRMTCSECPESTLVLCFARLEAPPTDTNFRRECPESMFALCSARFEALPADTNHLQGVSGINVCNWHKSLLVCVHKVLSHQTRSLHMLTHPSYAILAQGCSLEIRHFAI